MKAIRTATPHPDIEFPKESRPASLAARPQGLMRCLLYLLFGLLFAGSLPADNRLPPHAVTLTLVPPNKTYNTLNIQVDPVLLSSSTSKTELFGTINVLLNVCDAGTSDAIYVTGEGQINNTDLKFSRFLYTVRVSDMSGFIESDGKSVRAMAPTTGHFDAKHYRYRVNNGGIRGRLAGFPVNQQFTHARTLDIAGQGKAELELSLVSEVDGVKTYAVTVTLPVDGMYHEDRVSRISGLGMLKAEGVLKVPKGTAKPFAELFGNGEHTTTQHSPLSPDWEISKHVR